MADGDAQNRETRAYDLNDYDNLTEMSSMVPAFNGDAPYGHNDRNNFLNNLESTRGTMNTESTHSLHDLHLPSPSTLEQKQDATFNYFWQPFGILYAIFLFILGTLLSYKYPMNHELNPTGIILLYIIISGLVVTCLLIFDITRHVNVLQKEEKAFEEILEDVDSGVPGDSTDNGTVTAVFRRVTSFRQSEVPHDYCFVNGRHAGSTYLKFGTAAFAIGHLVHSLFLVAIQITFMNNSVSCVGIAQHIADIIYPIYSFLQLVFIFKYSNVIIMKYKGAATLLVLHIIAGNLCLWSMAVARETDLALSAYRWVTANQTSDPSDEECRVSDVVVKIFQLYSPYLMPFSVEFNISIVGFFYTILSNIGNCHCKHENESESHPQLKPQRSNYRDSQGGHSHTLNINMNCHRSSRGIFTGVALVVLLIAIVLVGFLFANIDSLQIVSYAVTDYTKLVFHLMMLVAVGVAYNKTRCLDVNQHPTPLFDDVLLYICVPAFFVETLFTVIATINVLNVVKLIDTIIMSIQMAIQTAFIIDGLRRCSNARKLRRNKPGRELVLFLLMMNVAMWVLYTFSYKSPLSKDERYVYFGKEFWTVVGHLTAPLIMFYRFHSSACIAEMWSYAYKPGTHDE